MKSVKQLGHRDRIIRSAKEFLIMGGVLCAILVLYVPAALLAARYTTTFRLSMVDGKIHEDFRYGLAVLIWPSYALVNGVALTCVMGIRRLPVWGIIAVFFIGFIIMCNADGLNGMLGLEKAGITGFKSWPVTYPGFNLAKASVISWPVGYVLGGIGGYLVIFHSRNRNRGQ